MPSSFPSNLIYANDYDPSTGTGTVLAELYLEKREPLSSLDEVGAYVAQGTVATEDVRFYEHKGVDLQGIVRALFVNLAGGQEEPPLLRSSMCATPSSPTR